MWCIAAANLRAARAGIWARRGGERQVTGRAPLVGGRVRSLPRPRALDLTRARACADANTQCFASMTPVRNEVSCGPL